jgi:hypothetical protein
MKAQKQVTENLDTHLSANDLRLKEYMSLDEKIKELTKRFEVIKDEIKHQGSFSTMNYVALVDERSRTNPPSLDVLIEKYGEGIRSLCKVSTYKTVKVSRKGGE